jgi:flagellar hook protein FlgE
LRPVRRESSNLGASAAAVPPGGVKWATSLGVSSQAVAVELNGGLTQYASPTQVEQVTSNGVALGSLANIEIDKEGFVNAIFDNGVTRRVAQIAVATFPNPDGLKALSGNAYLASNTSGSFNLKTPGAGGAGLLSQRRWRPRLWTCPRSSPD